MRSKSILAGAVNVPIEPTSNVDSRTTNNIIIKNYSSDKLTDETELKDIKETTANDSVRVEYAPSGLRHEVPYDPPPVPFITREAVVNPYSDLKVNYKSVDEFLLSLIQSILLDQDKKLIFNLVSHDQILLPKEDLETLISLKTGHEVKIDLLDHETTCCIKYSPFLKISQIRVIEQRGTNGVNFKYKYSNDYMAIITKYKICLKYVLVN